MRVVHEGRGGYIEIDDARYPIEHVAGGRFCIHVAGGRHRAHAAHLVQLRALVAGAPDRWEMGGRR